jgi:hypothetical protein
VSAKEQNDDRSTLGTPATPSGTYVLHGRFEGLAF